MKIAPIAALVALSPFIAAKTPASEPAAKRPPNIVLILIDDMGWKDIGANGSKFYKTPAIDKLASEGVRFTQAHSACAVCSPSRASILTGQNPARLHLTDWIGGNPVPKESHFTVPAWTKRLDPTTITIAELLRKRGYATASIGKWHLGGDDKDGNGPLSHGFDVNIGGGHSGHPASYFWPYGKKGGHGVPGLTEKGAKGEYLTDRLTDEALGFIDTHRDKPFFLYLPHYAVHGPLQAKPGIIAAYEGAQPDGRQKNTTYAAMVQSVDESVGRICAHLEKLGLTRNTLVVFTSDNGGVVHTGKDNTDNSPLRGGKGFPYEGGTRVPFIARLPGVTKNGLVSDAVITGTDLFPTFAKLAGISETPETPDSRDLTPDFRGEKTPARARILHYPHYWGGGGGVPKDTLPSVITPYSVIQEGTWKLIRWYEYPSEELYDLATDPSEKNDLAEKQPAIRQKLSAHLDSRLKNMGAQPPVPRPDAGPANTPDKNPARAARFTAN